ncbi:unnamed protein product [Owenia fusiformis]|uniref:Uncharacterized protein n=1 Tax=Owenia fusiformis TaxID=6347 RepID=A0A8J1TCT2_OWEFU|nr:unnamed protein product [Owenia fusiformis]
MSRVTYYEKMGYIYDLKHYQNDGIFIGIWIGMRSKLARVAFAICLLYAIIWIILDLGAGITRHLEKHFANDASRLNINVLSNRSSSFILKEDQLEEIADYFNITDEVDRFNLDVLLQHYENFERDSTGNKSVLDMTPVRFLKDYKNPCWIARNTNMSPNFHFRKANMSVTPKWVSEVGRSFGWKLRCLPYFYVVGMVKSGTSNLFRMISRNPEVATPLLKEYHWWSYLRALNTKDHNRKPLPLSDYVNAFEGMAVNIRKSQMKGMQKITGEASASTAWWTGLEKWDRHKGPKRTNGHYIAHIQPNAKIIFILRNPVDRLYSEYMFFSTNLPKSPEDFHSKAIIAITEFQRCLKSGVTLRACVYEKNIKNLREVGYPWLRLHIGVYYVVVEEWIRLFGHEHVLVVNTHVMDETMPRLFSFLQCSNTTHVAGLERIRKQRKPHLQAVGPMLNTTRELLTKFYTPFNKKLASLLHDNSFLFNMDMT